MTRFLSLDVTVCDVKQLNGSQKKKLERDSEEKVLLCSKIKLNPIQFHRMLQNWLSWNIQSANILDFLLTQ